MQGTIRLYRISLEKSEHKKMPFHIPKELLNLNQLTFIEHCKIINSFTTHKIFFKELLFNSLIINEILIILI